MRSIPVAKWTTKVEGKDYEESLLTVLSAIISQRAEDMPRGLDNFRLFQRLSACFTKAESSGTLELEEGDYVFLSRIIERGVPAMWAMNKNISGVIEAFLNAKEDKT